MTSGCGWFRLPGVVTEPERTTQSGAGFRVPAESAAIARIAAVTGELAASESLDAIVTVVADHISYAVQAAVSTLILRDGDRLVIAGQHGVASDKAIRWSVFPVSDENPASEAVRTGQPVIAATAAEVRRRYPRMAGDTPLGRSVISLPLRAAGEVIGAIGLTFEQNWNPGPFELNFLMTFADACAQAIRRVRATEEAASSATQLRFLASASAELSSSLDYRTTLSNVAQLSVPTLADWCAVDLVVDGSLTTLAVAHVDEAKVAWAWKLLENYPTDMDARTGAPNVVRSGIGELTSDITDEMLIAVARDEEHLRLCRELNMRSVIIVPLLARGATLGTMTLIRAEPSPKFNGSDLSVAEDLGRRAGVAIDNARLFDETANVAMQLQQALLPGHLGELAGWQTCAHYSPDGHADVGGDFFDAVVLPDGRLALFIGDVMGHGIAAAATMAQIRAAIRAFLTVDPDPEVVIGKLDGMFEQLVLGALVSLVYAVIDPAGEVRLANAGHCPPMVVSNSGRAEFLHDTTRLLLGAGPARTPITELVVEPGEVLLLYTDGLIERRDENIDAGLARLAEHGPSLISAPLQTALTQLVERVAADDVHDDIAVIAIRRGIEGS
jgi:GAF domain-containing protein